ncbi:uncharacterized protein LOC143005498 isoform X2 [Genypterus blacodes]|uniref:uncharacterized protein LOC143005498 isoform X2 n=1 Tax=Genypterus blacodes TaxID=154954 RepID=UPI003F75F8C5
MFTSKPAALDAPNLAVSSTIIRETDHVTLTCEPPPVSVERCYFYIDGTPAPFPDPSCKQTQPGTQLLLIAKKSLPAEVDVMCYYAVQQGYINSPWSDKSAITVQGVPAPGLTVSRTVITESDSVTLSCQTPSPAPDVQCYFYTARTRDILSEASCQQSFTGTELLQRSQQSSPAGVAVMCHYAVQQGSVTSPWSDISSITVQGEKPEMSCQHFEGEHVVMICSLPGSAKPHTVCNFYVGEARSPVGTQTIRDKVSASNKWFCQFYVQIADLLRDLRSVQPKVASCDYSLESEPNSVSARSDECSLTGIWEKESSRLQTIQTPTMSTEKETLKWAVIVAGCGVFAGIILLGSALMCIKRRRDDSMHTRALIHEGATPSAGNTELYSMITSVPGDVFPKGSVELKGHEAAYENPDTYHMYCSITEEPAAAAQTQNVCSTVQLH